MLRNIPPYMEAASVVRIDERLDDIQRGNRVALPLAVESGSRAWGFPSPDSDYDCRFIFLRSSDDYLALFPMRDVIEQPLEGEFDVNGWDLAKALRLLLRGNAVVIEWLTSPIIYRAESEFRDHFLHLATRVADRALVAKHYLHLGERQRRTYFAEGREIPLKKIFYALRPAAALRWLGCHPDAAVAPMHFPTLLAECDAPSGVRRLIDDLIVQKAKTRELGSGTLPDEIRDFVDQEFAAAHEIFKSTQRLPTSESRAEAEKFFRWSLSRFGP